jgi:hypothetical protein
MMMRLSISSIAMLSFALGCPSGTAAQPRNTSREHWQAVDKSMTDLLLEGYRPVSVIAPSPQRRIYFLSSGSFLAKCTEETTLARMPPPPPSALLPPSEQHPASTQVAPPAQGAVASAFGNFTPEMQATFECSRLSK